MTAQTGLDLKELSHEYEVTGELKGRAVRTFMARRRPDGARRHSDGSDVHIAVATAPEGDEGNALSHLAADAKLLIAHRHPNVVPVLDGRWVGTDAFAIVMPRISAPSLAELLARREEEFDYPRIATILREVNAALEWARGQKIVHRAIDPEALYIEPGSDTVTMSFAVRALPLAGMPSAEDDARAIAILARTMLTRSASAPERESQPLAEQRPGLPKKVIEQTEALLNASPDSSRPDISGYIASIAMADALKQGEIEIERMAAKWAAEERAMRHEIERLHRDNERMAAEQKRLFAAERDTIAAERDTIMKDRERLERDCVRQRTDLEHEIAKEREEIERILRRDREALDKERAALASLREQLKVPPMVAPRRHALHIPSRPRKHRRKSKVNWAIPATAAVLLAVAAGLFAVGRNRPTGDRPSSKGVTVSTITESASGSVGRADTTRRPTPSPLVATPSPIPADLVTGVASRAGGTPPPLVATPSRIPADLVTGVASRAGGTPPPLVTTPSHIPADLITGVAARAAATPYVPRVYRPRRTTPAVRYYPGSFRADTNVIRRDTGLVRRDTIRRDTGLVRRDTIRRDTLPR